MLRHREQLMLPLSDMLKQVAGELIECPECGNLDTTSPCHICTDMRRDPSVICVVEDLADLWAMERSHIFKGRYHILGGTLSAMDGRCPDALHIPKLIERAKNPVVQEVILATNATLEGQTTAHYLTESLSDCQVRVTRLAQGIPLGGELDYLDEGTLGTALSARNTMDA